MKRLDGWEPVETHTYAYDPDGRVASVTVTREVEWDTAERGFMLALALYEAQLCPHAHWLPEATDPSNEDGYRGVNLRCHACTAVSIESTRLKDNPHPSALMFGVERRR